MVSYRNSGGGGYAALRAFRQGMQTAKRTTLPRKKSNWLWLAIAGAVAALFLIKRKNADGETVSLLASFMGKK